MHNFSVNIISGLTAATTDDVEYGSYAIRTSP
jgi:hypothetical protein